MTKSITSTLLELDALIRERLDPLGYIDGEAGSFKTGHAPHVAPFAYLCSRYPGLDNDGIKTAEEECGRYISEPYRELLSHMNGAQLFGVSLHGSTGGAVDRSGQGMGQPISLWYQNAVERPDYIPQGHLGIGAINGEWSSQGYLYLTSTGEVELYNSKFDLIGANWGSLSDFLSEEIRHQFTLYDEAGVEIEGGKQLPGDTDNWEHLAQEAIKQEKAARSLPGRIRKYFRSN